MQKLQVEETSRLLVACNPFCFLSIQVEDNFVRKSNGLQTYESIVVQRDDKAGSGAFLVHLFQIFDSKRRLHGHLGVHACSGGHIIGKIFVYQVVQIIGSCEYLGEAASKPVDHAVRSYERVPAVEVVIPIRIRVLIDRS